VIGPREHRIAQAITVLGWVAVSILAIWLTAAYPALQS
jgi:hypothetical protein